jgi:hypothetical protein
MTSPLIEDMNTWLEETRNFNRKFYMDALVHGEISIDSAREFTEKRSKCDICLKPQKPGIRNFFYRENFVRTGGHSSFHFHLCDRCWAELMVATPISSLVENQHMTTEKVTDALPVSQ